VGGTKVLALVAIADGQVLGEAVIPTPASEGPVRVVEVMAQAANQAMANAGVELSAVHGVGIAAAGAIDQRRGIVIHSPHLLGWDRVPLVQLLQHHLQLPTVMDNDANLAALGEYTYGAGQGVDNLLFVTLSTGIGGGIIIGGRLYRGGHGFAGEVGHISVLAGGPRGWSSVAGAVEALASGSALAGEVSRRLRNGEPSLLQERGSAHGTEAVTAELIFEAYHRGDELARKVVAQAVVYLGAGLTSLVNVLDPELLIIGGGLANQWEAYIEPAVEIMRAQAMAGIGRSLRVVPAALGARAGALGAVALAAGAGGGLLKP
jgi:glucokinase